MYQITSWDALRDAFRRHYEVANEDNSAVDEYLSTAMACHKGESMDQYMLRAMAFRLRLPLHRASTTDFVERILYELTKVQPVVMQRVARRVRRHREENRSEAPSLHTLRGWIGDDYRDYGPVRQAAATPSPAHHSADADCYTDGGYAWMVSHRTR